MTPNISDATSNDVPPLRAMIKALCAHHGDPCHLGLAETQDILINGPLIALVAKDGPTPVGYAVMERLWKPMYGGWGYDICQLYVVETHRNMGIGKALISACRARACADSAVNLSIGTAPQNPGAAAAYRAMGLEERPPQGGVRFRVPM